MAWVAEESGWSSVFTQLHNVRDSDAEAGVSGNRTFFGRVVALHKSLIHNGFIDLAAVVGYGYDLVN